MWLFLKTWLYEKVCSKQLSQLKTSYIVKVTSLENEIQRLEDMLTNSNVKGVSAQQLYVTDHALHQYRKRIGFNGSNEELRKMIYKLTIRHLATMDTLSDGHYKINDKAAVRIKDNTICTIVPSTKRQS